LFSEINKDLDHNSQAMCLFIFVNFQKAFSLTANKGVVQLMLPRQSFFMNPWNNCKWKSFAFVWQICIL